MPASWAGVSACVVVGLLASAATTSGTMLTFTHTGNGSGTIGGRPFPASDFVITAIGDTANRWRHPLIPVWSIPNTSASIWIAGLGDLGILATTHEFVSADTKRVGFTQGPPAITPTGHDLYWGPSNDAFATWDMSGPIGPISGTGTLLQWGMLPQIATSSGVLIFDDGTFPATYTVAPEPAMLSLLALAGAGLMGRRRARARWGSRGSAPT